MRVEVLRVFSCCHGGHTLIHNAELLILKKKTCKVTSSATGLKTLIIDNLYKIHSESSYGYFITIALTSLDYSRMYLHIVMPKAGRNDWNTSLILINYILLSVKVLIYTNVGVKKSQFVHDIHPSWVSHGFTSVLIAAVLVTRRKWLSDLLKTLPLQWCASSPH